MIPQLIILGLGAIGLGMSIAKHGKPKEGNYSAGTSLFALSVIWGLYYWGGFFDCFLN